MADDNDIIDQHISYDDQNFNFDMDKMYNDFIKEIDSIRSYNIYDENTASKFLQNIHSEKNSNQVVNINVENSLQESRIHAFYRLIGLPVISSDFLAYSPGHDVIPGAKKISKDNKIEIANKPLAKFDELTLLRERYYSGIMKVFSQSTSVNSGAIVVSSGGNGSQGSPNIRKFISAFDKSEDAFDMEGDNQSYEINLTTFVGDALISINNFQDQAGNIANISSKRSHFIKPMIVNGKMDFMTIPSTRRICVPFVFEKNNTIIDANHNAKRPVIEKLIRDRVNVINKGNSSYINSAIDYVKNISSIKDEEVVKKMSTSEFSFFEKIHFEKYIKMIEQMMERLVEATNIIKRAQSEYYWLPQPNVSGPEKGSSVRPIAFPMTLEADNLFTSLDKKILMMTAKNIANKYNLQIVPDQKVDPTDFALGDGIAMFDVGASEAFGDASQDTLENLISKRSEMLSKANQAAQTIEIILGEFGGLGICDMIAIMAALHIMPINNLVGLIDKDARERMDTILNTKGTISNISSEYDAVKVLSSHVKDFYNLMDKIYVDKLNNNDNLND